MALDCTLADGASGDGTVGALTAEAVVALVDFVGDCLPDWDGDWRTCPWADRPVVGRQVRAGAGAAGAGAVWAPAVALMNRPARTISEAGRVAEVRRINRIRMSKFPNDF